MQVGQYKLEIAVLQSQLSLVIVNLCHRSRFQVPWFLQGKISVSFSQEISGKEPQGKKMLLILTIVLISHEFQVLERFLGSIPENNRYQQQILSMYLSCSGYTEVNNKCLDRVVCDYSDPKSTIKNEEKDVISM